MNREKTIIKKDIKMEKTKEIKEMGKVLRGKPVAQDLLDHAAKEAGALGERGIRPLLAIVRVGEKEADIRYEKNAVKTAEKAGVIVRKVILEESISQEDLDQALQSLNEDPLVHGILLLRPLPSPLDGERARKLLSPQKDVDGTTDGSLAGVFTGSGEGFSPCTAQAAMEILRFYGIDPRGENAVIIGRSLVVGRPLSMMLLSANATPTLCHTKTRDLPEICRGADILVAASGQGEAYGKEFVHPGQIVLDVGINFNEKTGKITGDMKYEEVLPRVKAITPVPGGVGAVTTAVLISHVVTAATRQAEKDEGGRP